MADFHAPVEQPDMSSSDVAANSAVFALSNRGTQRCLFIMKLHLVIKDKSATSCSPTAASQETVKSSNVLLKLCWLAGTSAVATENNWDISWEKLSLTYGDILAPTLPRGPEAHISFSSTLLILCSLLSCRSKSFIGNWKNVYIPTMSNHQ